MQKFVRAIKIMTMMIVDKKQKKMIPLANEEKYSCKRSRYCDICRNKFNNDTGNK